MCRCSRQLFALAYRMAKMVHPRRTDRGDIFLIPNIFRVVYINILRVVGSIYPEVRQTCVLDCSRRSWTCDEMLPRVVERFEPTAGLRSSRSRTKRRAS